MPIFDATITIEAPRVVIMDMLKKNAADEQIIALREAPILIVLRPDTGFVYVVGSHNGEVCKLRLIVDKAARVRDAFREYAPREALNTLVHSPRLTHIAAQEDAAEKLDWLCRLFGGAVDTSSGQPDDPPADAPVSLPNATTGWRNLLRLGRKDAQR